MQSDPLAHLRDIHLPPPIAAWPPAPGWILLACLSALLMAGIGIWCWKRSRNALPKQEALTQLQNIMQHFSQHQQPETAYMDINRLLKRLCLLYFPRIEVADLHGKAWIQFLNDTGKNIDFSPLERCLLEQAYCKPEHPVPNQALDSTSNLQLLELLTKQWIKQRGKPCFS